MILWQDMENGAQPSSLTGLCPFHQYKLAKNPFHVPLFLQLLDLPNLALYNLSLSHQLSDKKMVLCAQHFSHSTFSRCVHPAACPSTLFRTKWYSLAYTYYSLLTHQLADGHLGCLYLLLTVSNVLLWLLMYEFFIGLSPLYGTTMVSMVQQDCSPPCPMSLHVCKLPV